MSLRTKTINALLLASTLVVTSVQATPIVLGTSTLNEVDDLTQIQLDNGEIIEWLDISATVEMNISTALDTFGDDGFQLATLMDLQYLLDAFGLPTVTSVFPLSSPEIFESTASIVDNFTQFLGTTFGGTNATGFLDDELTNGQTAVLNVRGSNDDIFVNTANFGDGDNGGTLFGNGVWLFRPATEIPEPASLLLLGFGALLMGRRFR